MTVQIALLRAVNVASHGVVKMTDLKALFSGLGFTGVVTILQSGSVVFRATGVAGQALESLLEREAARKLGLTTYVMVRTAKEWAAAVANNPFPGAASRHPSRLLLIALKEPARAVAIEALRAAIKGRETVAAKGRHLYAVYPDGIGRSKLTMALIETRLGTRATGRNWNTALKIANAAMNT
jgi:uncharacterized protein (DUF1697 family)